MQLVGALLRSGQRHARKYAGSFCRIALNDVTLHALAGAENVDFILNLFLVIEVMLACSLFGRIRTTGKKCN
jgi:hypothetical protein